MLARPAIGPRTPAAGRIAPGPQTEGVQHGRRQDRQHRPGWRRPEPGPSTEFERPERHGCQRLDTIDYSPAISPELFLQQQHWLKMNLFGFQFIWSQPSSTVIVYLVGFFTMYVGYRFLKTHNHQQSLFWWGVGLLLTGLGALFAGTSYQALGYELKCNGRTTCTYTCLLYTSRCV